MKISVMRNYNLTSKDNINLVRVSIMQLDGDQEILLIEALTKKTFPARLRRKIYKFYRLCFPKPNGLIYTSKTGMFCILDNRGMRLFHGFIKADIEEWLEIE